MSQYDFSYNYDSLNDAFNAVNRKGKMQKRYLSPEYLDKAQEYREMRKELNEILRKKKAERTEEETSRIDYLKKQMNENAREQKTLLQEYLPFQSYSGCVGRSVEASIFYWNYSRRVFCDASPLQKREKVV